MMNNQFFATLLAAANSRTNPYFTIDLNITSTNLTFGVTPYWNSGGGCEIKWGDGQSQAATPSGTQLTHTYAAAGSYRVKVRGDMYRFNIGSTNPGSVVDCNWNWEALGDITEFTGFTGNPATPITRLPSNITNFSNGYPSTVSLELDNLPDSVVVVGSMLNSNPNNVLRMTKFPSVINRLYRTFRGMKGGADGSWFDLDSIAANAPEGGWTNVTSISGCFARTSGMNGRYDKSKGSVATFMRKFPGVYDAGETPFEGFRYASAVTTFGSDDYFEIVLTTTESNQVWGFTATSTAGTWYCFDWGDGTAVTANKNLDVFTNGTRIQHTFKNPGTYHIKLSMNADVLDTDAYDSDNGAYGMLTNDSIVFNGALYNGSMDFIEYTAQDLSILMGNDITYTGDTILIN